MYLSLFWYEDTEKMQAPNKQLAPIIIRKVQAAPEEGHHGGAWKVAYADFVTAMMAFFLLMWLLNATTEDQRKGIADYFDPNIPISRASAGGTGLFKGDSTFAEERLAKTGTGGTGREAEPDAGDSTARKTETETPAPNGLADGDAIQKEIESQVDGQDPAGQLVKHLRFTTTHEGLRIDIVDDENSAMFETASSTPTPRLDLILSVVASVLETVENDLSVAGHTDAQAYRDSKGYSNWELSSDRAQSARRRLAAGGLASSRFARVEGHADRSLLISNNPLAVQNRRISITILRGGLTRG